MIEFTVKYNGALAECKVSGYEHDFDANVDYIFKDKPIWECSRNVILQVLDAMRTIETEYNRQRKEKL